MNFHRQSIGIAALVDSFSVPGKVLSALFPLADRREGKAEIERLKPTRFT